MQIMVPIRDPSLRQSRCTLERASELAKEYDAHLLVLHINLLHHSKKRSTADVRRLVEDVVEDVDVSYVTRQGFLVEEIILDEVTSSEVDILVVGQSQRRPWRRTLDRLLGTGQDIGLYLQTRLPITVDVVGVPAK